MTPSPTSSSPADQSPAPALLLLDCPVCQSGVTAGEETIPCPSCGLVYHAECWEHNLGCATYGCDQVNALAPKPADGEPDALQSNEPTPGPDAAAAERLPWSFLLLGASAVALALSALSYGLPSLAVLLAIGWRMARRRAARAAWDPALLAAALLAVAGIVGGWLLSRIWWAPA